MLHELAFRPHDASESAHRNLIFFKPLYTRGRGHRPQESARVKLVKKNTRFPKWPDSCGQGLRQKCNRIKNEHTVDSLLADNTVKQTPRVGPCLSLLPLFDSLCKMDISQRRTLCAGPKGVRFKERVDCELCVCFNKEV